MKKYIFSLLVLWFSSLAYAETRDVGLFFDQNLGDLKAELANAKKEGKKAVLLMFELEDCPFCHRMKRTILNQSEVQDYYRKNFLIFSVDAAGANALTDFNGKETTEKAYALASRVRATPVFAFYDLDGNAITRYTGAAKDVNEFLLFGKYVAEGAYKNKEMSFPKYKQSQVRP